MLMLITLEQQYCWNEINKSENILRDIIILKLFSALLSNELNVRKVRILKAVNIIRVF